MLAAFYATPAPARAVLSSTKATAAAGSRNERAAATTEATSAAVACAVAPVAST